MRPFKLSPGTSELFTGSARKQKSNLWGIPSSEKGKVKNNTKCSNINEGTSTKNWEELRNSKTAWKPNLQIRRPRLRKQSKKPEILYLLHRKSCRRSWTSSTINCNTISRKTKFWSFWPFSSCGSINNRIRTKTGVKRRQIVNISPPSTPLCFVGRTRRSPRGS